VLAQNTAAARYPDGSTDHDVRVQQVVEIPLGTPATLARFFTFTNLPDRREHVLIGFSDFENTAVPLVRLHSECLTGDVFGSLRCDCGLQLAGSVDLLIKEGGCLLYLRQEGRGIGLYRKLQAYRLQDKGIDTFEANRRLGFDDDLRDYQVAALMLGAVGIKKIRLITNNPDKIRQLEHHGISVHERISTPAYVNPYNRQYLATKVTYGKHWLTLEDIWPEGVPK
jgi:GTP cyclohydrolase II